MLVDDLGYFERRAGFERDNAEIARNPYVRACHKRLAQRYEAVAEGFRRLPADWPLDRLS